MSIKFLKSDLSLAKTFLQFPYPMFVSELLLDMDIDYIAGLCSRFISKEKHLGYCLSDLDNEQITEIEDYLNQKGTIDDKIFYNVLLAIQNLLHKYYGSTGDAKPE